MSTEFFNFFDIVTAFFVLMLLTIIALRKYWKHQHIPHYRYFLPSLAFKIVLALSFGAFYVMTYDGGGDTAAYWRGAVALNNLFWESPGDYLREVITFKDGVIITSDFNTTTGFPPTWIYGEHESWLVCKIFSLFIIPGFKGYFTLTLIISYFSHHVTWKFFEFVQSKIAAQFYTALAILFIPSVALWCGGISKDTLLYISLLYFTMIFFAILKNPGRLLLYIPLLLISVLIIEIRAVIMVAVLLACLAAINRRIINIYQSESLLRMFVRLTSAMIMFLIIMYVFSNGSLIQSEIVTNMLSEASVVQQDFANNTLYGDNKYTLNVTDYSIQGMLQAMPYAIFAGLFRPMIFESLNPSLIISGIESTVFIIFGIRFFFTGKVFRRLKNSRNDDFLVYLLIIVLFSAFFAGFTSIIFGVLIRIRSLILPFFFLILIADKGIPAVTEHVPASGEE